MSFQQLLAWLHVARLEESKASEIIELVVSALDEVEEDDPNYDLLFDIENELLEGRVPHHLLHHLAEINMAPGALNDVERLAEDYRQIAKSYSEPQWQSNYYLELSRHLAESDDEGLTDFLDSLRGKLTEVWEKYSKDFHLVPVKSAETVVGHGLMQEAYEAWMEAFELLEEAYPDEVVLQAAERALRLLAAVHQLDRDVERQAKSLRSKIIFQTDC